MRVLGTGAIRYFAGQPVVPSEVIKAQNLARLDFGDPAWVVNNVAGVALLVTLVISLVGLFTLWRPARHFFLAALVANCALCAFTPPWNVLTNWETAAVIIEDTLAGVVLAVCYTGVGRDLLAPRSLRRNRILVGVCLVLIGAGAGAEFYREVWPRAPLPHDRTQVSGNDPLELAQADVERAIAAYKTAHGSYPASLADLGLTNFVSGVSTSYLACFEYSGYRQGYSLRSRIGGIGVQLRSRDFHYVKSVPPDSPAAMANLQPGDYIVSVDGKDVTGASYTEFVSYLRGPPGTSVSLTVRKKDSGSVDTVNITRAPLY